MSANVITASDLCIIEDAQLEQVDGGELIILGVACLVVAAFAAGVALYAAVKPAKKNCGCN